MRTLATAILEGLLVVIMGTLPWAFLRAVNLRTAPQVPWSVPVVLFYLWAAWRYWGGSGPPGRTAAHRRSALRANRLDAGAWQASLAAALPAIVALWLVYAIATAFTPAPATRSTPPAIPIQSLIASVVASAAVAALSEEAGYRGYMQRPLEARYGPVAAVAIVSFVFAGSHLTHGLSAVPQMPLYFLAGGVYGATAYLTNSILPGLLLHFVGDIFLFSMPLLGIHFAHRQPGPSRLGLISLLTAMVVLCFLLSLRGFKRLRNRRIGIEDSPQAA